MKRKQPPLCVRWMIYADRAAVLRIERASFEFPWSPADFDEILRQRECIALVAERGDTVLGYVVFEQRGSRLQLLNLAVDPQHRRCGVGAALLAKLADRLHGRRESIALEVRETNLAAQLFLRSCGFRAVGVRHGFYDDCATAEDAYAMEYRTAWPQPAGSLSAVNRVARFVSSQPSA